MRQAKRVASTSGKFARRRHYRCSGLHALLGARDASSADRGVDRLIADAVDRHIARGFAVEPTELPPQPSIAVSSASDT